MINKFIDFLLTGFYFGKIKYMPGTFGTLVAIPIYYYLLTNNLFLNIAFLFVIFYISIISLNYSYTEFMFNEVDDKSIVIDEIIGYLSFMIFFEVTIQNILIGFLLFRFFDIFKPFPINLVDKNMKNSFGVMFDDVLAALYSGISLYFINHVV